MSMLERVKDPILRDCMLNEYRRRAKAEWGYCPDGRAVKEDDVLPITPAQIAIHDKIKQCAEYGVWKQDEEVDKAARANMMAYIRGGGTLEEIPAHLRCEAIDQIYRECKDQLHKELMADADDAIKRLDAGS